ncbi:hypothetical protein [uncultured Tateyamaria sp.]|uniref:hypothetical protein n=1 Tax=uncultured Tateyamaria sp. TaxID=455651 RepID=UPI00260D596F|nr:hypothetical protein [uncultured Tateyamaria sp.]
MQYIVRQYEVLFPRLPYPIRLLLNLAFLPIILFWAMPRALLRLDRANNHFTGTHADVPEMDQGQFHLDAKTRAEVSRQPGAFLHMQGMIQAENWTGFLRQLKAWDDVNAHEEGDPLVYTGSRAARWKQYAFLQEQDDCSGMAAWELPWDAIEALEMEFARDHTDPRLAAVLARAHDELAWARRGGDLADAVSRDGWRGFEEQLNRANQIVSDFDAAKEGSYLLASVTHTIALSSEWEDAARDRAFQTCLDLNPKCWGSMAERAFHLLPRWGGDYEQLEVAARQAMSDTHQFGAAVYAAFYLGVINCDEGALFSCDAELFAEGLSDMAAAENGDQVLVNRLIETVIEIVTPQVGVFGRDDINARRADFARAADKLFRDHFCCHVTDVWTSAPQEAFNIAASMYAPELEAGQQITLSLSGGINIGAVPQT